MSEVVIGRFRPSGALKPEDLEIPGPGLYEADFNVPGWALPDYDAERSFSVPIQGRRVEHIWSRIDGNLLTIRFRVTETEESYQGPHLAFLGPLTIGLVVRAFGVLLFGALAVALVKAVVDALREIRKLGETPAGLGLAALGLAGGYAIFKGSR